LLPIIIDRIGWKTWFIFASCNFSYVFVVYYFVPEVSRRPPYSTFLLGNTSRLALDIQVRLPCCRQTAACTHIPHLTSGSTPVDAPLRLESD
jgi:hypothetical protein